MYVGLTEVWVLHGLLSCEACLMVITQKLVQKVQGFCTDQMLVLTVHKSLPSLPGMSKGKEHKVGKFKKTKKILIVTFITNRVKNKYCTTV